MPGPNSRNRRPAINVWPGWVDALSTLVMVIIFVLMVFVIAQSYLSAALSGREEALQRLNQQVAELANLLALERTTNSDLQNNVGELSTALQKANKNKDALSQRLVVIIGERDKLASSLAESNAKVAAASSDTDKSAKALEEAKKEVDASADKIKMLLGDIAVLESLRDELQKKLSTSENEKKTISDQAQMQVEMLNQQILALRDQLARLAAALDIANTKTQAQDVQIANLGKQLNEALANKVEELARYRSEFFGKLRAALGDRPDIRVVGDRFVFQSEVLFPVASADIQPAGRDQLARFAQTLVQIAAEIPQDIDWVLRVDGHTDARPINSPQFPSNWELSTARAISVVKFLETQGVPPGRLVAAGYAEFRPLDTGQGEDAFARNRRIELKLDQR
jgi:chemotaxis protein MotB